jgi:putative ABC transport system permease protein
MKYIDTIKRAGRSLKNAKARTLLTSLAIGVGAFTITLSLAAGEGGKAYTDSIVNANTSRTELLVTKKQPVAAQGPQEYSETAISGSAGVGGGGQQIAFLGQADLDTISKQDNVKSVTPNYSPNVRYITSESGKKFVVDAIAAFSPSVTGEYAAGSVDRGVSDTEIVIPEEYSKALGFNNASDAIGKTVSLQADKLSSPVTAPQSKLFNYTIKAVSSKSGLAFRTQTSVQISADASRELYNYINEGTRAYGNFLLAAVEINDASKANDVKTALEGKGFEAQTAEDLLGTVNTFINVLLGIVIGFGALAVLTSVFGIINTQYISVLERTQQIGLMKALGMRRRDVGRLFKLEAAWIGFLGGAIGAGLAVLAGTIANPFITEALDLGEASLLSFNPLAVAGVVIGLMLVAVASGILPARKASKLDPIEALRTE